MAIRITSAAFSVTQIQDESDKFTFSQLRDLNQEFFGEDVEQNVIDDLLELAKVLGCVDSDVILTTYQTSNGVFFSCPSVQLNPESKLSLYLGSEKSFEFDYDAKKKVYTIEGLDLTFKPTLYTNDKKEVKGVNLMLKYDTEIDGLDIEVEYSLQVKTKPEQDFKDLTKALQSGEIPNSDVLVQVGSGGSYAISLKPWMLPKGFYAIANMNPVVVLPQITIHECYCRPIDDSGEFVGDEKYLMSMNSNLFTKDNNIIITQARKGIPVVFGIDGAINMSMGVSAIADARILRNKDSKFDVAGFKAFKVSAKSNFIAKRRMNSNTVMSEADLLVAGQEYIDKRNKKPVATNAIVSTEETLAKVPQLEDLPF